MPANKKPSKCCSWCRKPKRCWYPCLYCIIPLFMIGLGLFAYEITIIIYYFLLNLKPDKWITILFSTSIGTLLSFMALCQIVCLLVIYEATGVCSTIFVKYNFAHILLTQNFTLCYIITLGLAVSSVVLALIVCDNYCMYGNDVFLDAEDFSWNVPMKYVNILLWISVLNIILIVFLLHLYIYYRYFFQVEKCERADKKNIQKLQEPPATPPNQSQVKFVDEDYRRAADSNEFSQHEIRGNRSGLPFVKLIIVKL